MQHQVCWPSSMLALSKASTAQDPRSHAARTVLFQTRQQGANTWQSVLGRPPSMMTPQSQQHGYTNVQRQPYCLMASSCPPHHHLPTDNRYHTIHTVSPLVGMWTPSHPTMSLNTSWMGIVPQLSPYITLFLPFSANTSHTCKQLKHLYNGSKQQYVFVYMRVCAQRWLHILNSYLLCATSKYSWWSVYFQHVAIC